MAVCETPPFLRNTSSITLKFGINIYGGTFSNGSLWMGIKAPLVLGRLLPAWGFSISFSAIRMVLALPSSSLAFSRPSVRLSSCFFRIWTSCLAAANRPLISCKSSIAFSDAIKGNRTPVDVLELTAILLPIRVVVLDTLFYSSGSDVTLFTIFLTSDTIFPMIHRGPWSLVILDRVSDCFYKLVFYAIRLCLIDTPSFQHSWAHASHSWFGRCSTWHVAQVQRISPVIWSLYHLTHPGINSPNSFPIWQSILPFQSHFNWPIFAFLHS